jgi:hypothetical protein
LIGPVVLVTALEELARLIPNEAVPLTPLVPESVMAPPTLLIVPAVSEIPWQTPEVPVLLAVI